jgi:hypothetical protein
MDLGQKLPSYLTEKRNITRLILFTALFALVFINIYSPFEVNLAISEGAKGILKFNNPNLLLFTSSSIIILTGVLVVVISRIILYQVVKLGIKITLGNFIVWIAAEIFFMAMFYVLFEILILKVEKSFFDLIKVSFVNTALVLLLPYSITWLYFSWIDKNKQIQKYFESGESPEPKEMLPFKDEKGIMRISVKTSDLLYLQAADNYVTIFYNHQQKPAKYMLRSSLKLIENDLTYSPLIRCHRSYMVNFEKVKIIRREKDGLKLELESQVPIEIPVSKTYMDDVFKAFGHDV